MNLGHLVVVVDLVGTFAFAANGAYAAVRAARIDVVGLVVLGSVTAVGGGIVRDLLLGITPPLALSTWVYLTIAFAGSLIPLVWHRPRRLLSRTIGMLDTIGLSLFCVVGAQKAVEAGLGPLPAIWVGAIAGVGGGVFRDVLTRRVPAVLSEGFYAIPAAAGAAVVALAPWVAVPAPIAMAAGAATCLILRGMGVTLRFDVPGPRS